MAPQPLSTLPRSERHARLRADRQTLVHVETSVNEYLILQAGTAEQPFYTNSSQLPVGFTDDPSEALMRQETLQSKYTGGTVLHLYMGERVSSGTACRDLVKRALTNFRLPYITVTPTFSICPTHGYLAGEHRFCPTCDEERLAAKRQRLAA